MLNTGRVCFGLFAAMVLSALVGCQNQRVRDPSVLDRQVLGPFAVHLAYTDGQKIFGRSAPTVVELAAVPTVTLLEPTGSVQGLSMTFFKNRRFIAWLDGGGLVHAGAIPGPLSGTVIVDPRPVHTRPGITATADRLYLTTSEDNLVTVFFSTDGQAWEQTGVVDLPFDVGATDVVHIDGRLWIAVTSKDRGETDSVMLVSVPLNTLGHAITGSPELFPVTSFPAAIDGSRGVRIAGNGSAFAVGCVSRSFRFPIDGESVRDTYLAVSDPADGHHVSWSRGSAPQFRGEVPCPVALVFVPRPGGSPGEVGMLGRVFPRDTDTQLQDFMAAQAVDPFYDGHNEPFRDFTPVTLRDSALAAGRELKTIRLEIRDEFRP